MQQFYYAGNVAQTDEVVLPYGFAGTRWSATTRSRPWIQAAMAGSVTTPWATGTQRWAVYSVVLVVGVGGGRESEEGCVQGSVGACVDGPLVSSGRLCTASVELAMTAMSGVINVVTPIMCILITCLRRRSGARCALVAADANTACPCCCRRCALVAADANTGAVRCVRCLHVPAFTSRWECLGYGTPDERQALPPICTDAHIQAGPGEYGYVWLTARTTVHWNELDCTD